MAAETATSGASLLADHYDRVAAVAVAARLGVPELVVYHRIGSTMDAAHALAEAGAPAGTLVLADEQTAGRGRQGRSWQSAPGAGIWLTVLERPSAPTALEVLSLRVGLRLARALDPYAAEPVRVKWPNDLFVRAGKVAGILVEARWRGDRPDWIAIGVGVNVAPPPDVPAAAGLHGGVSRLDVLVAVVPAVRAAAARGGPLERRELSEFRRRDYARGRRCVAPSAGVVVGVTPSGELAVETSAGIRRHRTGSLLLEEGA